MVEAAHLKQVRHRTGAAGLGIHTADDGCRYAGLNNGTGTHGTGLQCEVDRTVLQPPVACQAEGLPDGRDLGMRQIPVDNYTAVYVIQGDDVVALRVLYSASDINTRLREDR